MAFPIRLPVNKYQRVHWRPVLFLVTIPTLLCVMVTGMEASSSSSSSSSSASASDTSSGEALAKSSEECENPDPNRVRLVTQEELAMRNGKDGADIWISIMGEVYDVSMGEEYYAPGSSYAAFAGRDASVPFCTGKFTAEEAAKSTDVLTSMELPGLASWLDFYRSHKVYKFVGKLIDPRYFDENGEPTSELRNLQLRILLAKEEQALKAKMRREKRLQSQQADASQEKAAQAKASIPKASAKAKRRSQVKS